MTILQLPLSMQTNIPFLLNVLEQPSFLDASVDTNFIDEHPELFHFPASRNRAQKLLAYLGEVQVNGPTTLLATGLKPAHVKPPVPATHPGICRRERAIVLVQVGRTRPAYAICSETRVWTSSCGRFAINAACSSRTRPFATRVRTFDLAKISPFVAQAFPKLFSMENWGG